MLKTERSAIIALNKKKITDGQVAGTRPGFGANITYCLTQVVRTKRVLFVYRSFSFDFMPFKVVWRI